MEDQTRVKDNKSCEPSVLLSAFPEQNLAKEINTVLSFQLHPDKLEMSVSECFRPKSRKVLYNSTALVDTKSEQEHLHQEDFPPCQAEDFEKLTEDLESETDKSVLDLEFIPPLSSSNIESTKTLQASIQTIAIIEALVKRITTDSQIIGPGLRAQDQLEQLQKPPKVKDNEETKSDSALESMSQQKFEISEKMSHGSTASNCDSAKGLRNLTAIQDKHHRHIVRGRVSDHNGYLHYSIPPLLFGVVQERMFGVPKSYQKFSQKLAHILEGLGLNQEIVGKRRSTMLLIENMRTITLRLAGYGKSEFYFGSKIEGTCTPGLESDTDTLLCIHSGNVIQHWNEWIPNLQNLMMIQDETTPPGYCMLEQLKGYIREPLRVLEANPEYHVIYKGKRVLLKNTAIQNLQGEKSGPAYSHQRPGHASQDVVAAVPCRSLPEFVRDWMKRPSIKDKLSEEMQRYIEDSSCFVVAVGSKVSENECAQWRISTSHAERCFMLSLNITQLQCYVLMKIILKTYLNITEEKVLSSFMCKNVLLLCTERTKPSVWHASNLLTVFIFCLSQLRRCIQTGNCPHFILHSNNLLYQRLSDNTKKQLIERIDWILQSVPLAFLKIQIDNIGGKLKGLDEIPGAQTANSIIAGTLLFNTVHKIPSSYYLLLKRVHQRTDIIDVAKVLVTVFRSGSKFEQLSCRLLMPLLCSMYGCAITSENIDPTDTDAGGPQSTPHWLQDAMWWVSAGIKSDVAAGRLKKASVLYAVGNYEEVKSLLRVTQELYYQSMTESLCGCFNPESPSLSVPYLQFAESEEASVFNHNTAFCVQFLRCEMHCIPKEMQYEMFRSAVSERFKRDDVEDYWMDWAIVDSLPYLHFLQYKVYGQLNDHAAQRDALADLADEIDVPEYGHQETALNLLGHCLVQEKMYQKALRCYVKSLCIRSRNNAARLLICILLSSLFKQRNWKIY